MGMPLPSSGTSVDDTGMGSSDQPAAGRLESTGMEVDPAQTLEEKAKEALDCPCVANLRNGPCGSEFSSAFVCYVKSQEPEKGSDCVESFKKMQECMQKNENHFMNVALPPPERGPGEDLEDEDQGADHQEGPPAVPEEAIRYPPWYKR